MSDSTPAVFLSYAREDTDAARRIADALRSQGVEVWFDQSELRGGDAWDAKIRKQIKECAIFLPVISAKTQERGEGYFRLEWKLAVERTHLMAEGMIFLAPVVVDDTPESRALVPPEFMRVQWTRLSGGLPTSQFVEQVKRLLKKEQGAGSKEQGFGESGKESSGARRKKSGVPGKVGRRVPAAAWALALAVIVVALSLLWWRKSNGEPNAGAGTRPPTTETPAASMVDDKSIAVLPFTNMSEDKDNAFFADGMQEDILTNLALIREFRVVSRTSVMPYRTTTKSIRQIAQELGVAYILEGSVQREGHKVRVTGQLIHAAKDEHLWAKAYDRDLTDVFAIQSELSQEIATALKTALSPEEKVMLARRPTDNPAAYDLFLRARDVRNREGVNPAVIARQTKLLQSAVELDPNFAAAWAELADAYAFAFFTENEGKEALLAKAKAAMDRAVQLAPDDPEVIGSLGTYYYYGYRDYARAVEQYEHLARLKPNDPSVFNSLGLIQRRQGHWAESLVNTRRAAELDPANIAYLRNLVTTLQSGRRWEEAIAAQKRIVTLLPDKLSEAYQLAVLAFQATGSTREGKEFFAGLTPEQLNSPRGIYLRALWAVEMGDLAEAIRLDRLQPYFDEDGMPHWEQAYFAAVTYLAAGDRAAAVARLGDFPAELRTRLQREPTNLHYRSFLAGMEAILGHTAEARREADRCVELLPMSRDALDGSTYAYVQAFIYDLTGDKEQALADYARVLQLPSSTLGSVHELKDTPGTLRGDPRFEALLNDPRNNAPLF